MYYETSITIPEQTEREAPEEVELKLTMGIIHRVEIEFPYGCCALAHVALAHQEHQFIPTNPDGDIASDNYIVGIDEFYPLQTAPYTIKIRGWNEDDTYPHTIRVRVGVLRPEAFLVGRPRVGVVQRLKEALIGK